MEWVIEVGEVQSILKPKGQFEYWTS